MIVHFSASLRTLEDDIEIYRRILAAVRAYGNVIARDWVETAWIYERNSASGRPEWDWSTLAAGGETSIENAEAVIVEASGFSSFGVGYEASMAIQHKKPTLILLKKELAMRSYALGLSRDLVSIKTYDNNNLERVVNEFLKEYTIANKDLRFNFVIDRKIYNHLRKKSFKTGKTKAEIIRDLLIKDIDVS